MAPAMKAFSRQLIFLLFLVLLVLVATAHGGVCRPEKIQTFNYANLRQLTNVQGTIFLHTKTTCLGRLPLQRNLKNKPLIVPWLTC